MVKADVKRLITAATSYGRMALLALAFVLIAAPAAAAEGAPSANDGAIAFVCERKWETDDVSAKVTRYLTGGGRQREMYVEWTAEGSSGLLLSGLVGSDESAGEVALGDWSTWIGWPVQVTDALYSVPQILLGPATEGRLPQNASRPGTFSPDATMKWGKLRRLARGGKVEASLVDEKGHILRSGAVDVSRVATVIARARREVQASRQDVRSYRHRCQPFDPRVIVN
jgi:hypothetical protein